MRLIAIDCSVNPESFRKTRRILSQVLIRVTPRVFVGDLPLRAIEELEAYLRAVSSKSTAVLILVSKKEGYHGWLSIRIGSSSWIDKKIYFPSLDEVINMNKKTIIPEWKKKLIKSKGL